MDLGMFMKPSTQAQGVPAAPMANFSASGNYAQSAGGAVSGDLAGIPALWFLALCGLVFLMLHHGR